jgi:SAM-dependent methyltransferase
MVVQIDLKKYDERNWQRWRAIAGFVPFISVMLVAGWWPTYRMYRVANRLLLGRAKGKLLDVAPSLIDRLRLDMYAESGTQHAALLTHTRSDRSPSAPVAEEEDGSVAGDEVAALNYFLQNDARLVISPVEFGVVSEVDGAKLPNATFDTVVCISKLCTMPAKEAQQRLQRDVSYLADDGCYVLIDWGRGHNPRLNDVFESFNASSGSSMSFSHPYEEWVQAVVAKDPQLEVVDNVRCFLGCYYGLAVRRNPPTVIHQEEGGSPPSPPPTSS